MIVGTATNTVYYSELLEAGFPGCFQELRKILDKHNIYYKSLKATKDIWCRDYMPIQINDNSFVQFRYDPSYLRETPELKSNPTEICQANHLVPTYSAINLDGGNVINWTDKAIVTDRVFSENPEYPVKSKLIFDIERLLEVEVLVVPHINGDLTGHVDGHMRFIGENLVIGNNRETEYKYWTTKVNKILQAHGIQYIDIPFFEYKSKLYPDNAIGCYVNFLEVKDLIVIPMFETPGNKDKEVYDLFKRVYPSKHIETINFNSVGLHGGLLNCSTWTVKK